MAAIGLAQVKSESGSYLPLITAGNEAVHITNFLAPGRDSYTAAEVIGQLLKKVPAVPA
jgi:hypothetical protein